MTNRACVAVLFTVCLAGFPTLAAAEMESWLGDWAVRLSDAEMAEERGGLRNLSFAIQFEGLVNGVDGAGIINLIDPTVGMVDGVPTGVDTQDPVSVASFLGDVGPFQGIGQFAIVNGNGNEVSNNLTVNIYMMDTAGSISTFSTPIQP